MEWLIGRFDLSYLPQDPVTIGAAIGLPVLLIGIIAALTYFKKWKWLWREWITTVDAKKISMKRRMNYSSLAGIVEHCTPP